MRCNHCDGRAVFPGLCKEHFTRDFERRAKQTIKEYNLIPKDAKVCVAASGGKDSHATLHLLHKLGYDVEALAIDEGIADYREHSLKDLKAFCEERDIPLRIVPFRDLVGQDLDDIMRGKGTHACTVCGTFRRKLLNDHSRGYDIIATGHNADDEAQAVLMNILRAQTRMLTRPGPSTGRPTEGFTQRVKPLYFHTEKEIMTYAILHGFAGDFTECPYAPEGYRSAIRDLLNDYAARHPGTKQNILRQHLTLKKTIPHEETPDTCIRCGAPCTGTTCAACRLVDFHTKKQHVTINMSAGNNT